MTSFTSLLSSIGGGQPAAPQPNQISGASRPANSGSGAGRPEAQTNGARPATYNVAAGVKRKAEEQPGSTKSKVIKTEVDVPVRVPGQPNYKPTAKPASSGNAPAAGPYRGTARAGGATNPSNPIPKPIPKPSTTASTPAATAPAATANGNGKPKRGFGALLQKAQAAQEAAKAAGSSIIKHKPVEKISQREKKRQLEEAAARQKPGSKVSKLSGLDRSRSNTPLDTKAALQKKAPESSYKGTMRKPVERQEITYKGTMNKAPAASSSKKSAPKKNLGQDKYGGYASWSDLDAAEDEDEEEYDSDGSDMMDAGFDDMEAEERRALQAAKKEDQEALAEEERLRKEKLERKKKLEALSKSAAARKKY